MIVSTNSDGPLSFPLQRISDKKKNKKWREACVEAGVELVNWQNNNGLRKSKLEMKRLLNLVNGKIDPQDKMKITNPLNLKGYDFPGTAETYPLITPLMSILSGEERNRLHQITVSAVNHDAISEKQAFLKKQLDRSMIEDIQNNTPKEEIEKKMKQFGQWAKYEYKDRRERMSDQILSYLRRSLDTDFEFSRGFEILLSLGEEIYVTDIVADEPIMRKGSSLDFTFLKSNDTPYPENSSIIIEDNYKTLNAIVDEYYDSLTESQIKKLEEGVTTNKTAHSKLFEFQNTQADISLDDLIDDAGGIGILGTPSANATFGLTGNYDKYGRIRRTRVVWESLRRIGIRSFRDENGELQEDVVSEYYEPKEDQDEEVNFTWISEWWEGTKIADFYVKVQPREVQFRELTNLSKSRPGITGIVNNIDTEKITSFVSALKPIQYLYDEFVFRMEQAFMTSYGNIGRLDVSQVPDGWDMDKWLYYATTYKWAVQDPMKEGDEGAARGKMAGTLNQPSNAYAIDQGNLIQQNMLMLQYLEARADDVAGITRQRKGSTASRETMGGIERAVVQSSHRTEKWFDLHDHAKTRVYKDLLETAKVAWRKKKFKRSFFMDDMTQQILDFDGEVFNEAEYGIMINNSRNDSKVKNLLESSRDALISNGFSISSVIDILRTDNISTMQRKIEKKEEELAEARRKENEGILKQKEADSQRKQTVEQAKLELEERNNIRDNQTRILLKDDVDDTDNSIDLLKHKDRLDLDRDKLEETIRSNKADEKIKKQKSTSK